LWIATHGGLVKFNKQSGKSDYYNRANSGILDNLVASLTTDTTGNVWLGTQRNGVGMFDGENCTVYNTDNSGLPHDQWNHSIVADKQGNIWIGSLRYLSKFD
jgi:ligand-binding sensor domain-containing protein